MARRISRKMMKQDDFVDAAFDAKDWIERHWRTVTGAIAAVLVVAAIVGGWSWWQSRRLADARVELAQALRLYEPFLGTSAPAESGSETERYERAAERFEKVTRAGGNTDLGRVGAFYQAAALLRLGRGGEAIPLLERVVREAEEPMLADTARAMLAQAFEQTGALDRAVDTWRSLSTAGDPAYPPDMALLNLGRIQDLKGESEEARRTWQELLARHPDGIASREARLLIDRGNQ